jgi:hypothetical protein
MPLTVSLSRDLSLRGERAGLRQRRLGRRRVDGRDECDMLRNGTLLDVCTAAESETEIVAPGPMCDSCPVVAMYELYVCATSSRSVLVYLAEIHMVFGLTDSLARRVQATGLPSFGSQKPVGGQRQPFHTVPAKPGDLFVNRDRFS